MAEANELLIEVPVQYQDTDYMTALRVCLEADPVRFDPYNEAPTTEEIFLTIAPAAASLIHHVSKPNRWYPDEQLRRADPDGLRDDGLWVPTERWIEEGRMLRPITKSALYIGDLTEVNLDEYAHSLKRIFQEGAHSQNPLVRSIASMLMMWEGAWTSEEHDHEEYLGKYQMLSQAIDPKFLAWARSGQVEFGTSPQPENLADLLIYVALQEPATKIAHSNLSKAVQADADVSELAMAVVDEDAEVERSVTRAFVAHEKALIIPGLRKIVADEGKHSLFYGDAAQAMLSVLPSYFMLRLERQVAEFAMPGEGINGFDRHAKAMHMAGIFDLVDQFNFMYEVLISKWKIHQAEGLTEDAQAARGRILHRLQKMQRVAERINRRRDGENEISIEDPWDGNERPRRLELVVPKKAMVRVVDYTEVAA